jgi:hypothetical protein
MLNIINKFLKGDEDIKRNSKLQIFDLLISQYYRILEVFISTDLVYKRVVEDCIDFLTTLEDANNEMQAMKTPAIYVTTLWNCNCYSL